MDELSGTFIGALPDLTLVVRRDGLILSNLGGRDLDLPAQPGALVGKRLQELWAGSGGAELVKMLRVSLKRREALDARLHLESHLVEVRIRPQGVDRCVTILRSLGRSSGDTAVMRTPGLEDPDESAKFAHRFCQAIDSARLRETQVALILVNFAASSATTANSERRAREAAQTLLGQRLASFCRRPDLAAVGELRCLRIEAEQFAILIERCAAAEVVRACARALRKEMAAPIEIAGVEYRPAPKLGTAIFPRDGLDPDMLLEQARTELLHSKSTQSEATERHAAERARSRDPSEQDLAQELRWAIDHDQFQVTYEPVVELQGRRTAAYLTSARWIHAVCGVIPPARYRALLEVAELSNRLSASLLTRIFADLGAATRRGDTRSRVHVRLDDRFLNRTQAVEQLESLATAAEVEISRLDVDVDYGTLSLKEAAVENLRRLRAVGVHVFLDNVADASITLMELGALPLDGLKISHAAVSRCDHDPQARALCLCAGSIARAFGFTSIAVGVDRRTQLDVVLESGCSHAAGDCFRMLPSGVAERVG